MSHITNKAAIAINNGKYYSRLATASKQPRFKNSWWVTASCFQQKIQNRSIYSFQFEWRRFTVQFLGETLKFCVYLLGTLNWILLRCFVPRPNKRLQWKTICLKSQIIKYWKGSTEKCNTWWLEKFSMSIRKILIATIIFIQHSFIDWFSFLLSATINLQEQWALNTIIHFHLFI